MRAREVDLHPSGSGALQSVCPRDGSVCRSCVVKRRLRKSTRLGMNPMGPAFLGGGLSPQVSNGGLSLFAVGEPRVELPPGVECLA